MLLLKSKQLHKAATPGVFDTIDRNVVSVRKWCKNSRVPHTRKKRDHWVVCLSRLVNEIKTLKGELFS